MSNLKAYRGPEGIVDLREVVMVVGSSMFGQHTAMFVMRNGHKQQFIYPNKAGVTEAIDAMDQYLASCVTSSGVGGGGGFALLSTGNAGGTIPPRF